MERSKMVVKVADEDDALIGLPPGFRFHPTDEEIVTHYLTPKVLDRSFRAIAIGEADLNKSEPWDLPKKAKMGEKEWFFFCQRDRKYPTGMRTNRATESGYWKATGKDKEIRRPMGGELVGMKKTLVFYRGRAPRGEKTNWVMHEFRLEGKFSYYTMPSASNEDEWVVCRVFHKSMGAQKSPVSNHGLNSFVEDFLNSSPQLPPLMDHSTLDDEPSFTIGNHYFSHDQPEISQNEDYKNVIVSSSDYNFNDNSYHISSFMSEHQYVGKNPPCLSPESTFYLSNSDLMKEKKNVVDQCKVEHLLPTINQSQNINVSHDERVNYDMTSIETSSTSMLSKCDSRTRDYDLDDDGNDNDDPSMFSELDSLLHY